jgi:hypothetical protein
MAKTRNDDNGPLEPEASYPANEALTPSQGEPEPAEAPRHPIESVLTHVDETVRKHQGGDEGSGLYALLSIVAAQIGVKIPPPK